MASWHICLKNKQIPKSNAVEVLVKKREKKPWILYRVPSRKNQYKLRLKIPCWTGISFKGYLWFMTAKPFISTSVVGKILSQLLISIKRNQKSAGKEFKIGMKLENWRNLTSQSPSFFLIDRSTTEKHRSVSSLWIRT